MHKDKAEETVASQSDFILHLTCAFAEVVVICFGCSHIKVFFFFSFLFQAAVKLKGICLMPGFQIIIDCHNHCVKRSND